MTKSATLLVCVGILASVGSCGGGSTPTDLGATGDMPSAVVDGASPLMGANTLTYTSADNVMKTVSSTAVFRVASTPSTSYLYVTLSDGATGVCPAAHTTVGHAWVELSVNRAGSNAAIQPGTYAFSGGTGDAHAEGYVRDYEGTCGLRDILRNGGTYSGSLVITSVTATAVTGTFDFDAQSVTPSGMGHASGSFNTTACSSTGAPGCTP